jgi:hypothetical protein
MIDANTRRRMVECGGCAMYRHCWSEEIVELEKELDEVLEAIQEVQAQPPAQASKPQNEEELMFLDMVTVPSAKAR